MELEIKTAGNPREVRWYRNRVELTKEATELIQAVKIDDNNYKLIIPKTLVTDSGDYTVVIENNAGKAESDALINVEPFIEFLVPLKDLEVVEGELAEFHCKTNCRPRDVKWYKNGTNINGDNRIEIQANETDYKLIIKWSLKDDAGNYKIVIENTAGRAESAAKLTVTKAARELPKIVKGLIDQIVAEGEELQFEIQVEGNVNEVKWLKDDQQVEKNIDGAVIEKLDNGIYRLTIPKAAVKDAGGFEAIAVNNAGKAETSCKVEVDQLPNIVKGLEDGQIAVGDNQLFRVEVSTPVRNVKWYKNGQEIQPTAHFQPKCVTSKKYQLQINKAELDDGATYKVIFSI